MINDEEAWDEYNELYEQLDDKERLFVVAYCENPNRTQAAIAAGHKPGEGNANAANQGSKYMRKDEVRATIDAYMRAYAMSKAEALFLQSKIARGHVVHFVDEHGELNVHSEEARPHKGLIKRYSVHSWQDKNGVDHVERSIELYPADKAQVNILRAHGAFVDNKNITINRDPINEMSEEELDEEIGKYEEYLGEEE